MSGRSGACCIPTPRPRRPRANNASLRVYISPDRCLIEMRTTGHWTQAMTLNTLFEPRRDRPAIIARLLAARQDGATLREAACAAGVHVATVCRWARRDPDLASAL